MSTELTAELITSAWSPDDVRLSPDGSRVAWSAAPCGRDGKDAEGAVWVAASSGDDPARRWTYGGKDTMPRWSPEGTRLAILSDRKERGTDGLYLLRVDGGEAEPLVVRDRSVAAYSWSPDGGSIAFLAPDEPDEEDKRREDERDDAEVFGERQQLNRLHVVAVDSGEVSTLLEADQHPVDVAWSPAGTEIALAVHDSTDPDDVARASVWIVQVADGEARRVCDRPFLADLGWAGRRLVFVAPHEPVPQSSYTAWSVHPDPEDEPLCIGPTRDESACALGVRTGAGDRVAILVAEGLETRVEWADPETGKRERLWDVDGDSLPFDVAAGPVVAAVCSGRTPWEVWAGPPDAVSQRSDHHAAWAGVRFGTVEDFRFSAPDGWELDGVLIRPPGTRAGPRPTVVLLHGGPYGRSGRELHCDWYDWGQWLAVAGYSVLMPNYRGGLGHGNAFAASVRGDMGGAEWQDVLAAIDTAVDRGISDPDRLGVGGWSQGGFLTAWAVTRSDRFTAGVMGAGVSDWGSMSLTSDLPTFESELGGDQPWDGPGPHRADERSPMSYASTRRTPLLILHGQADARVPISQATGFHRALRRQDVPAELVTYPREPHQVAERRHQADILGRVREWYDRWLGPAGP